MKINIQKFQHGGQSYYYSTDTLAAVEAGKAGTSSEKEEDLEILNKEILNAITKSNMPNEVAVFEQEYMQVMRKARMNLDISADVARLRTMMSSILSNGKTLENAESRATTNQSLDEIAIDGKGSIYVMTADGAIDKVSYKKFDRDEHHALTYGELAQLRRVNPELINDQNVIFSIGNSVGTEVISEYILNILSKIGESESKQDAQLSLEAILHKKANMSTIDYVALKDLATLSDKIGLDALFKTTQLSSDKNLQQAWDYLLKMLPRNMEMQLIGSYIGNGGTYKDALKQKGEVIESALYMMNKHKEQFDIDSYSKDLNEAAQTKAGKRTAKKDGGDKPYNEGALEMLFTGNLNHETIELSDPTSKNQYGIAVAGQSYGTLVTVKDQAVRDLPMHMALDASVTPFLDYSKVYLGDYKTDAANLQNVMYINDKISIVEMPVYDNGDIAWEAIKAYSEAEKRCAEQGIKDINQKNQMHKALGSYIQYDANGKQKCILNTQPFFRTWGYTVDDTFPGVFKQNNPLYSVELTEEEEDNIYRRMKWIQSKDNRKSLNFGKINDFSRNDDIIKVPLFIKVDKNAATNVRYASRHGALQTSKTEEEYMAAQQGQSLITDPSLL